MIEIGRRAWFVIRCIGLQTRPGAEQESGRVVEWVRAVLPYSSLVIAAMGKLIPLQYANIRLSSVCTPQVSHLTTNVFRRTATILEEAYDCC